MLDIKNLHVKLETEDKQILRGVDLHLGAGLNREFWTGITVMAGLSGLLLSVLVTPMQPDQPRTLEG